MAPVIKYTEKNIQVRRFRDGGSREYYFIAPNEPPKLIVSAWRAKQGGYIVTDHINARASRTPFGERRGEGCNETVQNYIFAVTGIVFRHSPEGVVNV